MVRLIAAAATVVTAVAAYLIRPVVIRVEGQSMLPTLHGGDRVLAFSGPLARLAREGDIVVIAPSDHSDRVIKRLAVKGPGVARFEYDDLYSLEISRYHGIVTDGHVQVPIGPGKIFVLSDNLAAGIDSRLFGPIQLDRLVAWSGRTAIRFDP